MNRIHVGREVSTGKAFYVPRKSFDTHWHMIGGTGKGKTTMIFTLLLQLLLCSFLPACFIIIDPLGAFSNHLLMWMASPYCTDLVRHRLIYFEASRENVVLSINPLLYDTQANGHFKIARATELILRAWESQNIEAMPRLARWVFNCFWAAAQLGLTISDCVHFLMPGSPLHAPLIACLPEQLRYEWNEITQGRNTTEISRILESARNRLKPFFENEILRRMFGGTRNLLDMYCFMREARILLVNLAPMNRLSSQAAAAIGGLIINEVLAVVRSLAGKTVLPTFLLLDEFQNFVGPDLAEAIPEVRQLGMKLILSHQSLSQLKRGDCDLTSLIFTAQSRAVFGLHGEDADTLAHEFASLGYDPERIKQEILASKQRQVGHRIVELENRSESHSTTESRGSTESGGQNNGESIQHETPYAMPEGFTTSSGRSSSSSVKSDSSTGTSRSYGRSQTLVPIVEDFSEVSSRTFVQFDEQRTLWGQKIRRRKTGTALLQVVDDPHIHEVAVKRSAPGFLGFDLPTIHKCFPKIIEATERLIERNFENGPFCTPAEIEVETERRLARVLNQRIAIPGQPSPAAEMPNDQANPFA